MQDEIRKPSLDNLFNIALDWLSVGCAYLHFQCSFIHVLRFYPRGSFAVSMSDAVGHALLKCLGLDLKQNYLG